MSQQLYRDPWAKREAWRKHPIFSYRSMLSGLFPGLGIAIVAFSAYVLVDNLVHPANVEELKRAAKESASRPSLVQLLRGGASGSSSSSKDSKGQEQQQS